MQLSIYSNSRNGVKSEMLLKIDTTVWVGTFGGSFYLQTIHLIFSKLEAWQTFEKGLNGTMETPLDLLIIITGEKEGPPPPPPPPPLPP